MAEPNESEPGEVLVAVFAADQVDVVRTQLALHGCPRQSIRVGDEGDERWSLRAEQTEETDRSLLAPHAGAIMPKESAKATGIAVPIASAIGALICLPFAVIEAGDLNVWLRLFWCAVVGAALGATVAFIVAAAMAAKATDQPNAAQRGVVVRVDEPTPAVVAALAGLAPIRIDRFDGQGVVRATVTTEEDRQPGGIGQEVAANVRRELDADPLRRTR